MQVASFEMATTCRSLYTLGKATAAHERPAMRSMTFRLAMYYVQSIISPPIKVVYISTNKRQTSGLFYSHKTWFKRLSTCKHACTIFQRNGWWWKVPRAFSHIHLHVHVDKVKGISALDEEKCRTAAQSANYSRISPEFTWRLPLNTRKHPLTKPQAPLSYYTQVHALAIPCTFLYVYTVCIYIQHALQ